MSSSPDISVLGAGIEWYLHLTTVVSWVLQTLCLWGISELSVSQMALQWSHTLGDLHQCSKHSSDAWSTCAYCSIAVLSGRKSRELQTLSPSQLLFDDLENFCPASCIMLSLSSVVLVKQLLCLPVSATPAFSVGVTSSQPCEALLQPFCHLSCLMLKMLTWPTLLGGSKKLLSWLRFAVFHGTECWDIPSFIINLLTYHFCFCR